MFEIIVRTYICERINFYIVRKRSFISKKEITSLNCLTHDSKDCLWRKEYPIKNHSLKGLISSSKTSLYTCTMPYILYSSSNNYIIDQLRTRWTLYNSRLLFKMKHKPNAEAFRNWNCLLKSRLITDLERCTYFMKS